MNKQNYFKQSQIILAALTSFTCSLTFAAPCMSPQKLIEQMYNKFVIGKENAPTNFASNKKIILEQYLSKSLAKKIDNDNKCQKKTDLVCDLDFDILTDAQDTPQNPQYKFIAITPLQVNAIISGVDYKHKIIFKFSQENGCAKVSDILYPAHESLNHLLK